MSTPDNSDFDDLDISVEPTTTATLPPTWERRPEESGRSYAAFRAYLELGEADRSLSKVARKFNVSKALLGRWSAQHSWIDRSREWDKHVAEAAFESIKTARVRLAVKQIGIADRMFQAVERSLKRSRKGIALKDASRMFMAAIAGVRDVFGEESPIGATPPPRALPVQVLRNRARDVEKELSGDYSGKPWPGNLNVM